MWKDVEKDILFSHGLNSFIFSLRALQLEGFLLGFDCGIYLRSIP
nr:MAG TPA: hypothetical protein [Caudoviricetes sp.]